LPPETFVFGGRFIQKPDVAWRWKEEQWICQDSSWNTWQPGHELRVEIWLVVEKLPRLGAMQQTSYDDVRLSMQKQ